MIFPKQFSLTRGDTTLLMRGCLLVMLTIVATPSYAYDHIVTGLCQPENSIITSNDDPGQGKRLFVTSKGGFFELIRDDNSTDWQKEQIPNDGNQECHFLGITEMNGYIYTVCTEEFYDPTADLHLFALEKNGGKVMKEIANSQLENVFAPNGLTSDGNGNLYLADHGWLFSDGAVWQIKVNEDSVISEEDVSCIHRFGNARANGIRYDNQYLYVTINPLSYLGLSQLLRYSFDKQGKLTARELIYSSSSMLDDFALVSDADNREGGYLLAESSGARVIHISEEGALQHSVLFTVPSSVQLIASDMLLVTDYMSTVEDDEGNNLGAAYIWQSDWGLSPR